MGMLASQQKWRSPICIVSALSLLSTLIAKKFTWRQEVIKSIFVTGSYTNCLYQVLNFLFNHADSDVRNDVRDARVSVWACVHLLLHKLLFWARWYSRYWVLRAVLARPHLRFLYRHEARLVYSSLLANLLSPFSEKITIRGMQEVISND